MEQQPEDGRPFLSEEEQERIVAVAETAETRTSCRVLVRIVPAVLDMSRSGLIAASAVGFILAVGVSLVMGVDRMSMWSFFGIYVGLFLMCIALVRLIPALQKPFGPSEPTEEELKKAAMEAFDKEKLSGRSSPPAMLLFIALRERSIWLLPNKAAADKVRKESWTDATRAIRQGVEEGRAGEALLSALERLADTLARRLPPGPRTAGTSPKSRRK